MRGLRSGSPIRRNDVPHVELPPALARELADDDIDRDAAHDRAVTLHGSLGETEVREETQRRHVRRNATGFEPLQLAFLEREAHDFAGGLRGVAVAPEGAHNAVADLGGAARSLRRAERHPAYGLFRRSEHDQPLEATDRIHVEAFRTGRDPPLELVARVTRNVLEFAQVGALHEPPQNLRVLPRYGLEH